MKPRTFFGFALLFPYALWVVLWLVSLIFSSMEMAETWNMAMIPVNFYLIGIIVWFFPYTILAIGLWIWSKGKPTKSLKTLAMIAPFLLFILMWIEIAALVFPAYTSPEPIEDLLDLTAFIGALSVGFGYFCIGIAMGIYKLLQKRQLIQQDISQPFLES